MELAIRVDEQTISEMRIESDFAEAAQPKNDFARDLRTQIETLEAAGNGSNLKIAGLTRSLVHRVNPYLLKIKPDWNCRDHTDPENMAHVQQLAVSISHRGVMQPFTVHLEDGSYYVTDGHCRYLAVMHAINVLGAEVQTVPIREEDKYSSEVDRMSSQIVRNSGKPLAPLEMARVFSRLRSLGWRDVDIAQAAGLTRSRVIQLLELYSGSTADIKKLITSGQVTSTMAQRVIHRAESPAKAETELKAAVSTAAAQGLKRALPKHLANGNLVKRAIRTAVDSPAAGRQAGKDVLESSGGVTLAGFGELQKLVRDQGDFKISGGYVTIKIPTTVYLKLRHFIKSLKRSPA